MNVKKKQTFDAREFFDAYCAEHMSTMLDVMEKLGPMTAKAAQLISASLAKGGKWLLCGNGGSAADAQHLAAEMVGRLYKLERPGLAAMALTTDSSALTCVGNDYGFDHVFERQVEALGRKGDVFLGITTSGNSSNVALALEMARKKGLKTILFSGKNGGRMKGRADVELIVPGDKTGHIQEAHITLGHIICFMVEFLLLEQKVIKKR